MYEFEKLDQRVKNTREWTFIALHELLKETPLNDIKISSIIEKAGISRATFYRNFNRKEDIVAYKVKDFFKSFYHDYISYYLDHNPEDDFYLIQAFFKRVGEEEQLIETVIKCKLEYMMINEVHRIISTFKDLFYRRTQVSQRSESYTIEIVASAAWTLLARWYKNGKKESPQVLSKIYVSSFRNIYFAIFEE